MYVTLGYAVVIPDYTGLGTNFANAAADIPSNAADVIYSVPAARRAVRALGQRWVAMGREEGGLASLGVAERESEDPVDLGSIALSGLAELDDSAAIGRRAYSWPLVLAYGIKRIYPEFHESDILTPQASARLERLAVSCSEDSEKGGASAARLLKPNWAANLFVESYFRRNRLGLRPAARPLLILTSREDPWLVATGRIVHRLCGQGDRVQFELYPESDPGRVIGDSVRDQIAWIQARFSRRPAPTNCSAEH
jgi:hypothetical protein